MTRPSTARPITPRPSMIRRILPHPILSAVIVLVWLGLVNRFAWGSLVFAANLALVIPWLVSPFWPGKPHVRSPLRLAAYFLLVLWDIVRANIEVARIVLFTRPADLRPAWVVVPLTLTSPEGITVLAATITLTPGTVTSDISGRGDALLVHCLHAPDPDAVVADVKSRYESRLMRIFR